MKLLIWSQAGDEHGVAVTRALREQGHDVDRLFVADVPQRAESTYDLRSDEPSFAFQGVGEAHRRLAHDVVWLRRPSRPDVEGAGHPDDRLLVENECRKFVENLWQAELPCATWINTPWGRTQGNSKILQLSVARSMGLRIPRTLVSNNPRKIRDFIQSNRPGETIYKPLVLDDWCEDGRVVAKTRTAVVSEHDLPRDSVMRSTPGIFQERLQKDFEVRATFFDDVEISVSLQSQREVSSSIDWRNVPTSRLDIAPISLPPSVREACLRLMERLEIRFGCFDFVVRGGEWTFLEVNQMGQFLWMEVRCPELRALSTFCQFISQAHIGRLRQVVDDDIRLSKVMPGSFHETRNQELKLRPSRPRAGVY